MHEKTIAELSQGLRNKDYSSLELTKAYLSRIQSIDPSLNAFITVTEDQALTLVARIVSNLNSPSPS